MNMIPEMMVLDEPRLEKGFEFVDGEAVEKPMGLKSNKVGLALIYALGPFVRSAKLGHVLAYEVTYRCFPAKPGQIRKPDVTFVAKGRYPNDEPPDANLPLAPDLAVEVISPNDECEVFEQRVDELMSAGTRLLWIIHPNTRSAWVLRQDGTAARLTGDAVLSGEDVVPGFTCRLAGLFEDL